MRGNLIALDLETTGLDVENDSIIEIGAVRLVDGEVVAEYSTLVNPGFVIPAETTHITGIHQDDLRGAPTLVSVLNDVTEFVGDAPVIAHNVAFDISFMRRFGTLKSNLPIDTYDLAAILLPRVPRYSLSSLAAFYEIDLENAHRALDDARATAFLYWNLWEKALSLPSYLLTEVVRSIGNFKWESGEVFRAALAEVNQTETEAPSVSEVFAPLEDNIKPFTPQGKSNPIAMSEVDDILGEDGKLAHKIRSYEFRQEQVMMAQVIAESFNEQSHLLVEAGTGTGKSLAYLVPSVLWALHNDQRVVISTNTINLQDQLINKDIPLLQHAMDSNFRAAVMKGRGNYLCPRRLASVRRRTPSDVDELKTMAKILVWLQESTTGDKGELNLRSAEHFTWNRLSAEDEGCTTHRCSTQMSGACPYYKARKRTEAAQVVVANHALLISDALSENRVLPEYQYLVVDEAHQFEDAATNGLSTWVDQTGLLRRLADLGDVNRGLLGDLLNNGRATMPDKAVMRLEAFIQNIGEAVSAMKIYTRTFFNTIYQFIHDSQSDGNSRIRIDDKKRNHSAFSSIRTSWDTLDEYFDAVVDAMANLAQAMQSLEKYDIPNFNDHLNAVSAAANNLRQIRETVNNFAHHPDENTVYWINNSRSAEYIALQSAPLHVGPMMEDFVWNSKNSTILTSATLRTAGTFDYIRDRLYAENTTELALGSPFDYKDSTLVFVPDDIPQPNESGYQRFVERGIVELASALDGKVLALFTSYHQLRETAANISPRLALGNITVYDQATGGSRETLLDSFKSTEKAVLLGTRSFWEGIDIPGDDLSAVVIVRLPFSVPNDPIFAARSSTYRDAFNDYAVPDAILRFRQGFGRLIRTKTDRGIVAIFDSRVIQKSYGQKFLDSLPDCTIKFGNLSELGNVATNWLDEERQ